MGVSGNPSGKPKSVFSTQEQVAGALMERYTPSQILDIAGDPKKLDKLGTWSAVVMLQLANMLKSHEDLDFAIERERMLDRVVGKATQRVELDANVNLSTESALLEGRKRIAERKGLPLVNYSVVEPVDVAPPVQLPAAVQPGKSARAPEWRSGRPPGAQPGHAGARQPQQTLRHEGDHHHGGG